MFLILAHLLLYAGKSGIFFRSGKNQEKTTLVRKIRENYQKSGKEEVILREICVKILKKFFAQNGQEKMAKRTKIQEKVRKK